MTQKIAEKLGKKTSCELKKPHTSRGEEQLKSIQSFPTTTKPKNYQKKPPKTAKTCGGEEKQTCKKLISLCNNVRGEGGKKQTTGLERRRQKKGGRRQ